MFWPSVCNLASRQPTLLRRLLILWKIHGKLPFRNTCDTNDSAQSANGIYRRPPENRQPSVTCHFATAAFPHAIRAMKVKQ